MQKEQRASGPEGVRRSDLPLEDVRGEYESVSRVPDRFEPAGHDGRHLPW